MERLIRLINTVNRQGYNRINYQFYAHLRWLDLQLFEGEWQPEEKPTQNITIAYDENLEFIKEVNLVFVEDIFVDQKLDEEEFYKIIKSYLKGGKANV